MSDLLGINKAIKNINPEPFYIWDELFNAIDRDREMKDIWLWIRWSLYVLKGMAETNLEEMRKLVDNE